MHSSVAFLPHVFCVAFMLTIYTSDNGQCVQCDFRIWTVMQGDWLMEVFRAFLLVYAI